MFNYMKRPNMTFFLYYCINKLTKVRVKWTKLYQYFSLFLFSPHSWTLKYLSFPIKLCSIIPFQFSPLLNICAYKTRTYGDRVIEGVVSQQISVFLTLDFLAISWSISPIASTPPCLFPRYDHIHQTIFPHNC